MKRLLTALMPAIAVLAACNDGEAAASPSKRSATTAGAATAQVAPPGEAAKAFTLSDELVEFEYSYPAAAAALPSLKALLDADLAAKRTALVADAKEAKVDSDANDWSWRPYALGYEWKVVTELPRWLSLSTLVYNDTGGAHPNYWFDALLWDKTANRRVNAVDLFTSKEVLAKAIARPFCTALNRERSERRGEPVNPESGYEYDQCIDPAEQTVILGSTNRLAFDRIGILVSPYAAGPYAEGSYEVTVPVTPAVLAAVKPQYRASFAARR